MSRKLAIQVRVYPFVKGAKTKTLVVEDHSVDKASLRLEVLYAELQKSSEARILFHR